MYLEKEIKEKYTGTLVESYYLETGKKEFAKKLISNLHDRFERNEINQNFYSYMLYVIESLL